MLGKTLRKTVSGVAWVARGASMALGLAVVLALTAGVASTALAGTGAGASFDLGVTNTVNAISKLVGSVAGPSLQIDNNSTNASATALDLQVEPGKAPMKVNSGTKVTNLNADKLDGKDSTSFVPAVNDTPQPFTLLNGWTKADYNPNTPAFYKDAEGLVHLEGAIKNPNGNSGFNFATLPAGSRPNHVIYLPIYANTTSFGAIRIDPAGNVFVYDSTISNSNSAAYASLEGVAFRAAQ